MKPESDYKKSHIGEHFKKKQLPYTTQKHQCHKRQRLTLGLFLIKGDYSDNIKFISQS